MCYHANRNRWALISVGSRIDAPEPAGLDVISIKEVEHIARLARLSLSEEEKQLYTEQLAKILDYFDELKQVDTSGVEPMAHALSIVSVLRDDTVEPPPGRDLLLTNAPAAENGFFRVPKIGE